MDWLPYGSADASVLLQHPLTSDPITYLKSIGSAVKQQVQGGVTNIVADNTVFSGFDPVKGFCPNGTDGFRLQNLAGYLNLDYAGQMTAEVSRSWLCENNNAAPNYPNSVGDTPAANEMCLTMLPTTGGVCALLQRSAAASMFVNLAGATISQAISSQGKGEFVRINIGWNGGRVGGKVWYAVDGVVVGTGTRNASTLAGLFAYLYLGSDRGGATTFMSTGHYIRNLQISNKAPFFAFHPLLAGIGILSDSTASSDDAVNNAYRDAVLSWSMRRRLEQRRGLTCGPVTIQVLGGHRLDDSIQTPATGLLAVTANNTIMRSDGGSFLTEGYGIGSTMKATGFTNAANNQPYTISNVTATTLVLSTTALVIEGTGGSKQITGSYMRNWLPTILAAKPSVVVIPGGTNDASALRCSQANWQSKVTDYINDCFATDHVKLIVFAGPMTMQYGYVPGAYTKASEITAANTKIQAAITAWRVANPTDPRQIVFADRYNSLGAENPPPGTFIGQVSGLNDNLHCSSGGHVLQGHCVADAIITALT